MKKPMTKFEKLIEERKREDLKKLRKALADIKKKKKSYDQSDDQAGDQP